MKKLITTIAALALTVASYGQRTSTSFLELFWGERTTNTAWPYTPVFSSPSPTSETAFAKYSVVGGELQCITDGTWTTLPGTNSVVFGGHWSDVSITGVTLTTVLGGALKISGLGDYGSEPTRTVFAQDAGNAKILSYFIDANNITYTPGAVANPTVTGTVVSKTLTGCTLNYTIPITTVSGLLQVDLGTPALNSFKTIVDNNNIDIVIGTEFVESPWLELDFGAALNVTSNPYIIMNFEYAGNTGGKIKINPDGGFANSDPTYSTTQDLVVGSNTIMVQTGFLTTLDRFRIRTVNAIGTMKIKSILAGFSATTSVGIAGLTTLASGLIPKNTDMTLSGVAFPATALQGYSSFKLNDPLSIASISKTSTLTGAITFYMSGDGCVTLTGMAVENSSVKTSKVLCTVAPTVSGVSSAMESNTVSVSPNPTTDLVSVSASFDIVGLKVYSLTGTEVASSISSSVSLSGLSSGTYILEVSSASGIVRKKVVKL